MIHRFRTGGTGGDGGCWGGSARGKWGVYACGEWNEDVDMKGMYV